MSREYSNDLFYQRAIIFRQRQDNLRLPDYAAWFQEAILEAREGLI